MWPALLNMSDHSTLCINSGTHAVEHQHADCHSFWLHGGEVEQIAVNMCAASDELPLCTMQVPMRWQVQEGWPGPPLV